MARAVFCTVKSTTQAALIVDRLKASGFHAKDISVLAPDKDGTKEFAIDNETKAPEGAAAGVGTGALVGGGLGWLAGIGALAIPGVGPLIAAGPIMAALTGAAVGGSLGGITGALIGLGIPRMRKETLTTKEEVQGTWNQLEGAIKSKYSQITGNALAGVNGNIQDNDGNPQILSIDI